MMTRADGEGEMSVSKVERQTNRPWRAIGLRMHVPKGQAVAHAARGLAELFDVETGEPLNAKWDNLTVDFSPEGAVLVTVKLYPQKIEIEELP